MTTRFDPLFSECEKKHRLARRILKAIAFVESSWRPDAYRYEPAFYERYLKDDQRWAGKDPREVSASYGLCQLMFTTAVDLGYEGRPEGLYDPEVNIDLAGKYLRQLLDVVWRSGVVWKHEGISALDIALARYNGGFTGNPRLDGTLRNQSYVDKVFGKWKELRSEGG